MRVLAIESATAAPAVALVEAGTIVAERAASAPSGSAPGSETLLPAIDALLRDSDRSLADLDGFAIAIGPGSFTGLRVGLATLKGLAFADPRPAAAVSTLAALARRAGDPRPAPVVALLDARRGEVYAAAWDGGSDPTPRLLEEGLHSVAGLAARLTGRCLWVGDAVEGWPPKRGDAEDRIRPVSGGASAPCAGHVGILGARELEAGRGLPAAELVPRYLRRAEAEVRRTGQALEPR